MSQHVNEPEPLLLPVDEPLPQTMRFVLGLGVFILVGWFAMFALLQARW